MRRCWFHIQHGRVSSNCQQTLSRRWRLLYVLFDNDKILLPSLQISFVQQMFSTRREWRDSWLETWKERCLLWTLFEGCWKKRRRETKTKHHTRKICFPSYVRNYFIFVVITNWLVKFAVKVSIQVMDYHLQTNITVYIFPQEPG